MTLTFKKNEKTAYIFPGQGSQSVGMGLDLYRQSGAARGIFEQVDAALGRSLTKLIFEGPDDDLRETVNAQPAIMAVSLACVEAMKDECGSLGVPEAYMMAGHSLGEYTALAAAKVLGVAESVLLVQRRGELMQAACEKNPGTMAAVLGLDEMILEEVARESGVYVSNVNTTEQIVISGHKMSVARAMDMALIRGARKVIPIMVGGAFHSGLMDPAKIELQKLVSEMDFCDPEVPIIANCTGRPLKTSEEIKNELVSQMSGCVQWKRSVDQMISFGVTNFLEIGPGKAISGMVKRISVDANVANVTDMESITALSRT